MMEDSAPFAEAHDEIARLCTPGERWRMSIPANPDRDSDLILSGALNLGEEAIRAIGFVRDVLHEASTEGASSVSLATVHEALSGPRA